MALFGPCVLFGFNEAGAIRPRKDPAETEPLVGSMRFNEAGAIRPRKARRHRNGMSWLRQLQ